MYSQKGCSCVLTSASSVCVRENPAVIVSCLLACHALWLQWHMVAIVFTLAINVDMVAMVVKPWAWLGEHSQGGGAWGLDAFRLA